MNSSPLQLDNPIAVVLSDFNATTFCHDACSNETSLPNRVRIRHTHSTTQSLDLGHANMLKDSCVLCYAINGVEEVPPLHHIPFLLVHPIIVH